MSEPTDGVMPMTRCETCDTEVPEGRFCGLCGRDLTLPGHGRHWLRMRTYAAAPSEHLLRASVASSLFPHLPAHSRTAFRVGLTAVLVTLVVFAVLRLPAALAAVAALGLPLLFFLYLLESDVHRDLPLRTVVLAATLGVALGVGWVLLTGADVARSYGVALGSGTMGDRMLREGLGVPIGGLLLMIAPAVVIRLTRPSHRESLDGFMVGALGALAFTAAATLTRVAPQFASGMVAHERPITGLLVEAGIRGIAVPVTAAAAGGIVGTALWFKRPPHKADITAGHVRLVLTLFAVVVLAMYAGPGLVDVAMLPQVVQLIVYLLVAVLALIVLRIGLQLALLHEQHDEAHPDQPLVCEDCGRVVPDMPFCPACGAATLASSRTSRTERRDNRPARDESEGQ